MILIGILLKVSMDIDQPKINDLIEELNFNVCIFWWRQEILRRRSLFVRTISSFSTFSDFICIFLLMQTFCYNFLLVQRPKIFLKTSNYDFLILFLFFILLSFLILYKILTISCDCEIVFPCKKTSTKVASLCFLEMNLQKEINRKRGWCTMRSFDCAQICELVALFIQGSLENILLKTNFGL